jgi:hypothetical protein
MSLEVEIKEFHTYLSIRAGGEYSLATLRDFMDKANQEAEKHGRRKLLLDISEVAGPVPVLDMLVLGEHCARAWSHSNKIAIVSRKEGINSFFENVACNRGLSVAVFLNEPAALSWLKA